jgi:hypothetical protein
MPFLLAHAPYIHTCPTKNSHADPKILGGLYGILKKGRTVQAGASAAGYVGQGLPARAGPPGWLACMLGHGASLSGAASGSCAQLRWARVPANAVDLLLGSRPPLHQVAPCWRAQLPAPAQQRGAPEPRHPSPGRRVPHSGDRSPSTWRQPRRRGLLT